MSYGYVRVDADAGDWLCRSFEPDRRRSVPTEQPGDLGVCDCAVAIQQLGVDVHEDAPAMSGPLGDLGGRYAIGQDRVHGCMSSVMGTFCQWRRNSDATTVLSSTVDFATSDNTASSRPTGAPGCPICRPAPPACEMGAGRVRVLLGCLAQPLRLIPDQDRPQVLGPYPAPGGVPGGLPASIDEECAPGDEFTAPPIASTDSTAAATVAITRLARR